MRALHSHHTLPAASHCVCVCVCAPLRQVALISASCARLPLALGHKVSKVLGTRSLRSWAQGLWHKVYQVFGTRSLRSLARSLAGRGSFRNPRTLSLACYRCKARSGRRVLACRTLARWSRHRHLQWVGAPAVRVVMRRVEFSTGAPLPCVKHDSRAVSAITGGCSAASHTGLCPCTQRPVRHRDPGRVDACIVPPPPSLPECRAAAPLASLSLIHI